MARLIQIIAFIVFTAISSFSIYALDFPLPKNNFVSAKMPMHVVYPRPDTETQKHARHRWAHPDFRYEIPIGIQGGAWPFKYEILSGPVGSDIGQYYGDTNYGVVTWMPAANSGTEAFTVRVTDQDLNSVEIKWEVTVDANQFVFIQDGYTGSKMGTITQPLGGFAEWYKGDREDATYHNKIIVFRGGNYVAYGAAATNGNVRLDANTKTPTLIGYPDEWPVIDMSQAKIFTDTAALEDIFIAGIRWENGRQDVNNAQFFWSVGADNRATWWNNYFINLNYGLVGNDNTTTVFLSDISTLKEYFMYKNNKLEQIHNEGFNGSYVEAYVTDYVLIEENIAKNSDTAAGFFPKATVGFVTVRANEAYENVSGSQAGVGYDWTNGHVPHDTELCWNRFRIQPNNKDIVLMMWAHGDGYQGQSYNSYVYRNTFVNGSTWLRFADFETDGNVVVTDFQTRWGNHASATTIPDLIGFESAGITDDTGVLIGVYRANYLGLVGHEISSKHVTTPSSVTSINIE